MRFYQKLAKKPYLSALVAIVLSFVIASSCLAEWEPKTEPVNVFLPENLVFENIYYAAGENLNLKAQMKDDVYLAGLNIDISGPVDGDVIAVGSKVVINSEIKGNLRVIARTVILNGKVDKNVTILSEMVTISAGAEIGQSLIVAGSNLEINGKINKNIYGGASNLSLNGEILGSAYLAMEPAGNLILYPQANIHGNLEYTAKRTAEIKTGAKIGNQEKFTAWQMETKSPVKQKFSLFFLTWWIAGLLGALVVGLVLVIIFKDYTLKVEKQIDKNILMAILKGLVYLIVTPIALVIMAFTIIGLPLAVIMGVLYGIILYLTKIFVGIYLGEKLIRLIKKKIEIPLLWSMICGLVIIYLLCLIPYFGWIIKLIVVLWGLGVIMSIIKKDLKLENN